jgi:hypothetical protein
VKYYCCKEDREKPERESIRRKRQRIKIENKDRG